MDTLGFIGDTLRGQNVGFNNWPRVDCHLSFVHIYLHSDY